MPHRDRRPRPGQASLYAHPVPHQLTIGDCRRVMATMATASVDAIVTDPPYELGFMGRGWDASGIAYDVGMWEQALRVLKPGGWLLAFGATRTWHRLAVAVEDAGFEMRDTIVAWLYGQGFPKSLDVSKAIDKAAGAERQAAPGRHGATGTVVAIAGNDGRCVTCGRHRGSQAANCQCPKTTAPATEDAARWEGWGTGLKPCWEPCLVARKPLDGTCVENVLAHGTGALNVNGCRIGDNGGTKAIAGSEPTRLNMVYGDGMGGNPPDPDFVAGRWPTNGVFCHHPGCVERSCHPECHVLTLDSGSDGRGESFAPAGVFYEYGDREASGEGRVYATGKGIPTAGRQVFGYGDRGGPSRFFPVFRYTAKAGRAERVRTPEGVAHETVKPLDLWRWLIRLVTPPAGTVFDPFCGSGTTIEAAHLEGMRAVAAEQRWRYLDLSRARAARVGADLEVTSVRRREAAGG